MHRDGDRLYLQVTATGRSWILRYQLAGRRREMGLGSLEAVGPAVARKKTAEARKLLDDGKDPIEVRKAEFAAQRLAEARTMTFADCCAAYVKAHEAAWQNEKHVGQWRSTLGLPPRKKPGRHRKSKCKSAIAVFGKVAVADVDTPHVMECLRPMWEAGLRETCLRTRGRIERVLDWAKVSGYRTGENPARWKGHVSELLGDRENVAPVEHFPAVPYADLPAFMAQLAGLNRPSVSSMALRFTILTAARTNQVIGMQWPEIDLEAKVWTCPKERMKGRRANRREHRVPLSETALAVVQEMAKIRTGAYVFPGARRGQPLSDMAMLECLRGLRPGLTVHGMRSSFKDWAMDLASHVKELHLGPARHVKELHADHVKEVHNKSLSTSKRDPTRRRLSTRKRERKRARPRPSARSTCFGITRSQGRPTPAAHPRRGTRLGKGEPLARCGAPRRSRSVRRRPPGLA